MRLTSPYDSFEDPYCYPGTATLKNKLDLRDYAELEAFEHESVSANGEEELPSGRFDTAHYRSIHRHLFSEVYDWAGEYRTVRTAKAVDMFCYPEHIADQMDLLFASLNQGAFLRGTAKPDFVKASAKFLSELNAIHPFREGNGRCQLSFLFLLGERSEHRLDMTRVRAAPMLEAMVESFHGRLGALEEEIKWLYRK